MPAPLIVGGGLAAWRAYKAYKAYKRLRRLKKLREQQRRAREARRKAEEAKRKAEEAKRKAREADKKKNECKGDCKKRKKKDPCAKLKRRLREHEAKLEAYRADPKAFDHEGRLGHSPERDRRIIDGRIRHLEQEIRTFKKNIAECEARNATS